MGSSFEETFFDFDLNFLPQPSNVVNDCKFDKQKKAVLLAKKKLVATDSLIRKYYGKKEQLDQTELALLAAKEECKQVCIDYKEGLEKCAQLEKDLQFLRNKNKQLESNCYIAQNQVEGMKSHAHQLQMLVKEQETAIEALKVEKQLGKTNVKDNENDLLKLQKENATILHDICLLRDIVLGKKKLRGKYKLVLQKYEKVNSIQKDDTESESSCEENDLFDSVPTSPLSPFETPLENKHQEHEVKLNQNPVLLKKDVTRLNDDSDSVLSNEIVSEDTGCGSSLAFSDGEKCINSPDYFCNDSPYDCNKIKSRKVYVDACTSPTVHAFSHIATSPILFDDEALLNDNNTIGLNTTDSSHKEYFITEIPISTEIVTIKEKKQLVDVATNTFVTIDKVDVSTSPLAFEELDVHHKKLIHSATSPIPTAQEDNNDNIIVLNDLDIEIERLSNIQTDIKDIVICKESKNTTDRSSASTYELKSISRLQEETCLELNISKKICSENSTQSSSSTSELNIVSRSQENECLEIIHKNSTQSSSSTIELNIISRPQENECLQLVHENSTQSSSSTSELNIISRPQENECLQLVHENSTQSSSSTSELNIVSRSQENECLQLVHENSTQSLSSTSELNIVSRSQENECMEIIHKNSTQSSSSTSELNIISRPQENECLQLVHENSTQSLSSTSELNIISRPQENECLQLVHENSTQSLSSTSELNIVSRSQENECMEIIHKNSTQSSSSTSELNIISRSQENECLELVHENSTQSTFGTSELKTVSRSQEDECLELNNSKNLCNENSDDCEIEMILNSMRLTHKLITPIPNTPMNMNEKSRCRRSPVKQSYVYKEVNVCPEATKLREENKILHNSIAHLSKEIMNIKCILKNKLLMPESPKKQICENMKKRVVNCETFDNSSQQEIFITSDCDQNSNLADEEICVTPDPPVQRIAIQEDVIDSVSKLAMVCQTRKGTTPLSDRLDKPKDTLSKEENVLKRNMNRDYKEGSPLSNSRETVQNLMSEDDEIGNNEKEYVTIVQNKQKNVKCKKLSKLDRFRKKLLPKNKIKTINAPIHKLRSKAKPVSIKSCKDYDEEKLLKNKSAYEKAVKVMSELRLKKTSDKKEIYTSTVKKVVGNIEHQKHKAFNNNKINIKGKSTEEHLSDNVSKIEQPIVESEILINKEREKQQEDTMTTSPKKSKGISNADSPTRPLIITRSRSKINLDLTRNEGDNNAKCKGVEPISEEAKEMPNESNKLLEGRRRLKRAASDSPLEDSKRTLRSAKVRKLSMNFTNVSDTILNTDNNKDTNTIEANTKQSFKEPNQNIHKENHVINKSCEKSKVTNPNKNTEQKTDIVTPPCHPKDSILCKTIGKFGRVKIKYSTKKIPDNISDNVCQKLEEDIKTIIELSADDAKTAMKKLVEDTQKRWSLKSFQIGLMKYLKNPARKHELFNKVCTPPAPPMTKSEQILLFIIRELQILKPNTVNELLTQIEFSLFQLNKTPEFDAIESLSHFYALLCRYFGLKNRLRVFLLDAMYCLQFKVVPLIKHCLDVWMHILPLAHMGIAKTPLVTCLVYLLHFYKCEDKFNRIQEIRFILNKKYSYQITDWNEPKVLEMFTNSIKDLRDNKLEKKMLRMAFIILAKRQGPKWCQKNIIKNMLLPMIEEEDTPKRIKQFCIEMLGPLMKPYPVDMKVNCEIVVTQLVNMLDNNNVDSMKEAIFTSLIYMNKHNQSRVNQGLLSWSPEHVSPEFEEHMRDYVRNKTIKGWKTILSKLKL